MMSRNAERGSRAQKVHGRLGAERVLSVNAWSQQLRKMGSKLTRWFRHAPTLAIQQGSSQNHYRRENEC